MSGLAGLTVNDNRNWRLRGLAGQLHVDHTLVRRALERTDAVGLYLPGARLVNVGELEQLLVLAARFIAPVKLARLVAGVPAAWAVEPIASLVRQSGDDPPPVWPSATGRVRGQAFEPLHPRRRRRPSRLPRSPSCSP